MVVVAVDGKIKFLCDYADATNFCNYMLHMQLLNSHLFLCAFCRGGGGGGYRGSGG